MEHFGVQEVLGAPGRGSAPPKTAKTNPRNFPGFTVAGGARVGGGAGGWQAPSARPPLMGQPAGRTGTPKCFKTEFSIVQDCKMEHFGVQEVPFP